LEKIMQSKLFVGNLSYRTTEDDLRTLFAQAGTVTSVVLVKDRDTGRSRGFAFVEMSSQVEAQQAINLFDGTQLDERTLKINFARPREEMPRGGGDRYRGSRSGDRPRSSGPKRY
jgi:RNA recognition motif-containing protein